MLGMGEPIAVLDQALYSIGEAARLLEIVPSRLRRWLEGARVRGVSYPPVIRRRPTGSGDVTWAEFVEAGLLREKAGNLVLGGREALEERLAAAREGKSVRARRRWPRSK